MNPNAPVPPVVAQIQFPTSIFEIVLWLFIVPRLIVVTARIVRDLAEREELLALLSIAGVGLALRLLAPFGPQQWYFGLSNAKPGPGLYINPGSYQPLPNRFIIFGLEWATPIPLPEQTLVLGMGAARRAPSWDMSKGQFVPVMEANLTLSFDHRVLDGGAAGRLLSRVAELLSHPDRL